MRTLRLLFVASSLGVLIAVIGLMSATVVGSPQWSPLASANLEVFVGRAIHLAGSTPFPRLAVAQEERRPEPPRPPTEPPVEPGSCPRRVVTLTEQEQDPQRRSPAEQLTMSLQDESFAGTISIPSGMTIDLGGRRWLPVRSCVRIKSTRHRLDPGALLYTRIKNDRKDTFEAVFEVTGQVVRIEGLRFEGPAPSTDRSKTPGTVGAILISGNASSVLIANNSFAFWNQGIRVDRKGLTKDQAHLISVTRNYFNRNANERQGHGVGVHGGYVQIEGNLFNGNRHAVAATGTIEGGKGYIARYNYVLEKGFTVCWPCYWNQHFDVHGSGSGGYGRHAGEYFDIAFNTVRGEQTYGIDSTRPAFMLRGKPKDHAYFRYNVVVHDDAGKAVRLKKPGVQCLEANPLGGVHYSNERCNLTVDANTYNIDTTGQLAVGDFDGDGRDDIFLANGTGWWYSSAGLTEWRFLRPSSLLLGDLRFGRFDVDPRTDVLFSDGTNWWVSSGGTDPPRLVRNDGTRLTDCVFGDFDRDGITDALRADGSTWSVSLGANSPWITRRDSRLLAPNVRVGNFTGEGADDIFWIESGTWNVWNPERNVVTRDHRKPVLGDINSLVVADFDGDGVADLGQTEGDGWRWLRGGTNNWERLRDSGAQSEYKEIRWALLGRFTPERRLDAIRYASSRFSEASNHGFVLWGGTGDAFAPWTPPWQEMR